MAALKTELGKVDTFLDRVIAALPEDKREAFRSEYSQVKDAVAPLDDLIVKVQTTAKAQADWWTTNEPKVKAHDELAAKLAANRTADDTTFTKDEVTKLLGDTRAEVLGMGLAMVTDGVTIGANHLKEFGEVLDMQTFAVEAMKAGQTLKQYYDNFVAPRRTERTAAAHAAEIAKAREDGLKEGRAAAINRTDFPAVGSRGPTTLAGLRKPTDGQPAGDYSLDAAVATATAVAAGQQQ